MLKSMTRRSRHLAAFAVVAAGILPAATAQAQSYGTIYVQQAPLYIYEVQTRMRDYPYVHCLDCGYRPRLAERKHVVEEEPVRWHHRHATIEEVDAGQAVSRDEGKRRVIRADAEVIILGSDRINIRLFRKARDRGVVIHGDE
jgi:hypothetical protein